MPIKSTKAINTKTNIDIYNATINSMPTKGALKAVTTADELKDSWTIIDNDIKLKNEFVGTLLNRIGKLLLTSKSYKNPWAWAKKGLLQFGELVEDIYINLAEVEKFDPEGASTTLYARTIPDVKTSIYRKNYDVVYPATIQLRELSKSFLTDTGLYDFVAGVITSQITASEYDEFAVMKYMLGKRIAHGLMGSYVGTTYAPSTESKELARVIKRVGNKLTFMNPDNNPMGVYNFTLHENQYIIVGADDLADMDIDVLAVSFNMSKAEIMGHIVMVDDFTTLDNARLSKLFGEEAEFTQSEIDLLSKVYAVIVDENFFQIYDAALDTSVDAFNAKGLYTNYFLHVSRIFAISPFSQSVAVVDSTATTVAGSIVATPASGTVEIGKGQTFKITSSVNVTSGFAMDGTFVESDNADLVVNPDGTITVKASASAGSKSVKIKALQAGVADLNYTFTVK